MVCGACLTCSRAGMNPAPTKNQKEPQSEVTEKNPQTHKNPQAEKKKNEALSGNKENDPLSAQKTQPSAMTSPTIMLPISPDPPQRPAALSVPEFYPASHVGPDVTNDWPRPVTVVLHGNYDRPEWECDTWKGVAGFYGWVLCPRGVRTPHATLAEDRWTYRGPARVQKEIEAGLTALEARYPGRVSMDGTVLVGFSLGGIYAPGLAIGNPGKYPYLFLVEGGEKKLDKRVIRALKKAGVRGVALAMSLPGRRRAARDTLEKIIRVDIRAVFVDMKGAGHGYRSDFGNTGRKALQYLVRPAEPADAGEGSP